MGEKEFFILIHEFDIVLEDKSGYTDNTDGI